MKKDVLSQEELQANYGITAQQLLVSPDIADLFKKAWKGQWTQAHFNAELEQTNWYQDNAKPMREYLLAASNPDSADWIRKKADSLQHVKDVQLTLGANLSEQQLSDMSVNAMMYGWNEPGREDQLRREMSKLLPEGTYGGDIQKNADALSRLASANGVEFGDVWFQSAGKSIASKLTDSQYWETQIRQESASMFPVFKDQILNGMVNAQDIASPYMKMMQDTLGINADAVRVNDPTILRALTNYDDKGNPTAMNLGAFQQQLRSDPRWLETDKAQNQITGVASRVLEMFGITGGGNL
jgi:CDP-glycerol glycerophosphotransferase (TagB/SpsB family)